MKNEISLTFGFKDAMALCWSIHTDACHLTSKDGHLRMLFFVKYCGTGLGLLMFEKIIKGLGIDILAKEEHIRDQKWENIDFSYLLDITPEVYCKLAGESEGDCFAISNQKAYESKKKQAWMNDEE